MKAHRAKKHVYKCNNCLFITVREEHLTRHNEECKGEAGGEIPVIQVVRMERRSVDIDNVLYTPPSSPTPAPSNIFDKIHVNRDQKPKPRSAHKTARMKAGKGSSSKKTSLKRCRYCTTKVVFDSVGKLREHHHRAHGIGDLTVPFACRQFRCKECSVSFDSVHDLREHGEKCRKGEPPSPSPTIRTPVRRKEQLLSPPSLTPKSPLIISPPPKTLPIVSTPMVISPRPLATAPSASSSGISPCSSSGRGGEPSPAGQGPSPSVAPRAVSPQGEEEIVVDECGKQDILNHILQSQRQIGKAESMLSSAGLTGLAIPTSIKPTIPSPILPPPKSPIFSLADLQYLHQYYLYQAYLMNLLYKDPIPPPKQPPQREHPEAKLELTEPTLTTTSTSSTTRPRSASRNHCCFVTGCVWTGDKLSELKRHVTEQHRIRITSTMLAEWDQQIRAEEGRGEGRGGASLTGSGITDPLPAPIPVPIRHLPSPTPTRHHAPIAPIPAAAPAPNRPGNKCTHCSLTLTSFDAYVHHLIEAHRNVLGIVSKGALPNTFNTQLPPRSRGGGGMGQGGSNSGTSPSKKPKLTLTSPKLVTDCSNTSGEKT
eukprot:sb/3463244/